MLCEVVVAVK